MHLPRRVRRIYEVRELDRPVDLSSGTISLDLWLPDLEAAGEYAAAA